MQRHWQILNDIVYLLIGMIEIIRQIKKVLIGINQNNILEIILIREHLPICLDVFQVDTGQVLNIKIKKALLVSGYWMSTISTEAEATFTTIAAFAVSRTLCSPRSGLISDYLTICPLSWMKQFSLEEHHKFRSIILPESGISRDNGACNQSYIHRVQQPSRSTTGSKRSYYSLGQYDKVSGYQCFRRCSYQKTE